MYIPPLHDLIAHSSRSVIGLLIAGLFSVAINLFLGTMKLLSATRRSV